MGLAHLNLVSVLSFPKAWYHRPRYRFLVSVLSFFEENAQITKPMSNRRLLSTTQIKSVAHVSILLSEAPLMLLPLALICSVVESVCDPNSNDLCFQMVSDSSFSNNAFDLTKWF